LPLLKKEVYDECLLAKTEKKSGGGFSLIHTSQILKVNQGVLQDKSDQQYMGRLSLQVI
jgi:hypothetical protein